MIPGSANPLLLASAAAAPTGYAISRSLRFNSADSAYLSWTPASAGNRRTWTWAGWVKRSNLDSFNTLFEARNIGQNPYTVIWFINDKLELYAEEPGAKVATNAVFRDTAAWYHVTVSFDSTQAAPANRVKLCVNGILQDTTTTAAVAENTDYQINSTRLHAISFNPGYGQYFNGYLADIHFIDGQALDPTSFGEFDTNGIWQPKAYSGTYGTNGFHLAFSDNSTAGSLGDDSSGNGNNWTVNNISVAAGAGNDSLVDVPTNGTETDTGLGGEVRGNYATLNPLAKVPFGSGTGPMANGNLELVGASGVQYVAVSTVALNTNVYAEFVGANQYLGLKGANSDNYYIWFGTNFDRNGSNEAVVVSYNSTDVVGIAFNPSTLALTFYKNGAFQYTKTIASGEYVFLVSTVNATNCICNFGQRPFAYTAPSGFKALCTANLPPPVITKPSEYMDVKLYTGNGGTQTISGLEFSPDLVWIKDRTTTYHHWLTDTVRGASKQLSSSQAIAETSYTTLITAFNSDGFALGSDTAVNSINNAYVAWIWDAGSSTAPNTDGSITSSVRANPSAGLSIVTYTGNSTFGATVGHGLGVAPAFIITKNRDQGPLYFWTTYHASLGATKYLQLNDTAAAAINIGAWNNTAPTSNAFTLGNFDTLNRNGDSFVAYCFAPVEGYSAFGSYTGNGNGSADGPFIYTGFRPRWILIKSASGNFHWTVWDAARDPENAATRYLYPSSPGYEVADANIGVDFLSNGFKIRGTDQNYNGNENNHIYVAFAESPFQYARAR